MEFFKQWHLLDSMKFLKPHIVPRPTRYSQNVCETVTPVLPTVAVQGKSHSPGRSSIAATRTYAPDASGITIMAIVAIKPHISIAAVTIASFFNSFHGNLAAFTVLLYTSAYPKEY